MRGITCSSFLAPYYPWLSREENLGIDEERKYILMRASFAYVPNLLLISVVDRDDATAEIH